MGYSQNNQSSRQAATVRRRWPLRLCLRKGCGNRFRPGVWNQRYCQEPACRREVRRWFAARRQRKRRASATHRQQHAQAERQRRIQKKQQASGQNTSPTAAADQRRAWSRSKHFHEEFCDRPGCYQPRRTSPRAPAKYCDDDCRQAVRRVMDRERKWKRRNTSPRRPPSMFKDSRHGNKSAAWRSPEDSQPHRQAGSVTGGGGQHGLRSPQLFAVF